jgi:hypothetical protein
VDRHRTGGKLHASWDELLEGWREATERLAAEFAAGEARVDPKKRFASCAHCDLAALCRVREALGAAATGDEGEEGEEGEAE